MRHKYGSYYADWRDQFGKRHMKAFKTARAARAYTARMRSAIAKKARRSAARAPSPKPGS